MNFVEAGLAFRTHGERSHFERSADSPHQAQQELLLRLVRRNQCTAFGKDHGFPRVGDVADYQRLVPIRDYEKLRPYVRRLLAGERDVLTADAPIMFATTSGTSGEPKFIPVTAAWCRELAELSRLWMSYAARDHRGCFGGSTLMVAGAAVEGFAEGGLPYGSMSGVLCQRIPWAVRRHFAIPYAVSLIADPDVRYFVTMRMALARSVTALATPNATTLLRLAETAAAHSQEIIKAIHDGTLGVPTPELVATASRELSGDLLRHCRPCPMRARELEALLREHGRLRPRDCWPRLKFIGCWLGGSVGAQAGRLECWYGSAAQRDLGLIASEGRMTIPLEDGTPVGCLTIHRNFFEFIPEGALEDADPPVLLAHELELGKRYSVVVTGSNGLWRYDMNDLVEVRGFLRKTPTVTFIRKTRDVLSVTGEKVHVD